MPLNPLPTLTAVRDLLRTEPGAPLIAIGGGDNKGDGRLTFSHPDGSLVRLDYRAQGYDPHMNNWTITVTTPNDVKILNKHLNERATLNDIIEVLSHLLPASPPPAPVEPEPAPVEPEETT